MKKTWLKVLLVASVVFQLSILVAEYGFAHLPLLTGEAIRVETEPYDPRSLLRGNYARLNYGFSQLPPRAIPLEGLRVGEVIYTQLEPGEDGIFRYHSVSLAPPASGIFLRGRIRYLPTHGDASIRVEYGIEAFFAPKEEAIKLEKELRNSGIATLKVDQRGHARLISVNSRPTTSAERR